MSRSKKKRPYASFTTTQSEKEDKQRVHRRERHAVRQLLHSDPRHDLLPNTKNFGDSREFGKDGKIYLPSLKLKGYIEFYWWMIDRLRK